MEEKQAKLELIGRSLRGADTGDFWAGDYVLGDYMLSRTLSVYLGHGSER